ncbi:MAG: hypothetical protein ABIP67_09190, partial [Burkholderiales bacterium]
MHLSQQPAANITRSTVALSAVDMVKRLDARHHPPASPGGLLQRRIRQCAAACRAAHGVAASSSPARIRQRIFAATPPRSASHDLCHAAPVRQRMSYFINTSPRTAAHARIWPTSTTRTKMQKLPALLVLLSLMAEPATAGTAPVPESIQPTHRVTFAFHSAFLMNLHHFLYDMAVHKEKLAGVAWHSAPTEDEMRALRKAVDFYGANYAGLGLMEDMTMVGIKHALSIDDTRRDATGLALPPALAALLNEVAPVYARCLWPLHDKSNRSWIAQASALDTTYGAEIQALIERHLGASFPPEPIRDDVVFDTGSRQGAYTDEQTVMPSGRANYQGLASLEML